MNEADQLCEVVAHCYATHKAHVLILVSRHRNPRMIAIKIGMLLASLDYDTTKIAQRSNGDSDCELRFPSIDGSEAVITIRMANRADQIRGYSPSKIVVDELLPFEMRTAALSQSGRREDFEYGDQLLL